MTERNTMRFHVYKAVADIRRAIRFYLILYLPIALREI